MGYWLSGISGFDIFNCIIIASEVSELVCQARTIAFDSTSGGVQIRITDEAVQFLSGQCWKSTASTGVATTSS